MRSPTEQDTEVGCKHPDVGARGTLHGCAHHHWVLRRFEIEAIDRHGDGIPLDLDPLASELM